MRIVFNWNFTEVYTHQQVIIASYNGLLPNRWQGIVWSNDQPGLLRYKCATCGPFYLHGLTLIPAWISNYMPGKVWGEITYPFLNFNGCTVEV